MKKCQCTDCECHLPVIIGDVCTPCLRRHHSMTFVQWQEFYKQQNLQPDKPNPTEVREE